MPPGSSGAIEAVDPIAREEIREHKANCGVRYDKISDKFDDVMREVSGTRADLHSGLIDMRDRFDDGLERVHGRINKQLYWLLAAAFTLALAFGGAAWALR